MITHTAKLALLALGIVAVAALITYIGTDNESREDIVFFDKVQTNDDIEINLGQSDDTEEYDITVLGSKADPVRYVSVENCKGCHEDSIGGDQYEGWSETGHGKDFTPGSGIRPAINTYDLNGPDYPGSCAFCHAVGIGDTDSGGFDMDEPWASGTPTADQEVGNVNLIGIQCESCHGPGSEHSEINGNPSVEESCYADGDSGCHGPDGHDKYTVWKASAHSNQDQLDIETAGGEPHGLNSYCARCKSPSQYDPTANFADAEVFTPEEWHGIGCADCHDPHSDEFEYQLRTEVEDACTICHTSEATEPNPGHAPHHVQKEAFAGVLGIGVSGQKGMAGVTCVDCHMWESPEISHGYYLDNAIVGEHKESHDFEPKAEACADCHSDLVGRMPDGARPANNTGENEELWDEWDEFGEEWNATVEMWENVIHDWEENYERLFEAVEHNWETATQAITDATANGTASAETIAEGQALLDDAEWNIGLANDGSSGVHNPDFFTDLLNQANVNSNSAMKLLTTNGLPIANAGMSHFVDVDEDATFDGLGSSDPDGTISMYHWDFGDGTNGSAAIVTHSYPAEGTYLVMLTVTDNSGGIDKDMITVFVVIPPEIPVVDLTNIERTISEIKQDRAEINKLMKGKVSNISRSNEKIEEQTAVNKKDIEDLDDTFTRISGALSVVLIIVLVFVLAIYQHGAATMKNVVRENKEGILEALRKTPEGEATAEEEDSESTKEIKE